MKLYHGTNNIFEKLKVGVSRKGANVEGAGIYCTLSKDVPGDFNYLIEIIVDDKLVKDFTDYNQVAYLYDELFKRVQKKLDVKIEDNDILKSFEVYFDKGVKYRLPRLIPNIISDVLCIKYDLDYKRTEKLIRLELEKIMPKVYFHLWNNRKQAIIKDVSVIRKQTRYELVA